MKLEAGKIPRHVSLYGSEINIIIIIIIHSLGCSQHIQQTPQVRIRCPRPPPLKVHLRLFGGGGKFHNKNFYNHSTRINYKIMCCDDGNVLITQ